MPETETYDVWVITDPSGPVLYFPVASSASTRPGDHVDLHRRHAARTVAPDGLIEGVWERARQRLAVSADRLVAEIADPEVDTRRAAQRAATMARGADAAAWAPEELLAEPEPTPRPSPPPRPARRAAPAPRSAPARPRAAPAPPPRPAEPEEAVCPNCFMMRRTDQLDGDGICDFCRGQTPQ